MQAAKVERRAQTAGSPITSVHLIVNPKAGDGQPALDVVTGIFREAGVKWRASMTQGAGDARVLAQSAVADGAQVIAVYGGDGTLAQVAGTLVESQVPLAILPGGTANVLAHELCLPGDIAQAARLLQTGGRLRFVDVGQLLDRPEADQRYFLTRVGFGLTGLSARRASTRLKHRFGPWAYLLSGLQSLHGSAVARYHLELDGYRVDAEGLGCVIANAGHLAGLGPGLAHLALEPAIDIGDGWLDVVIIPRPSLHGLLMAAAHWRPAQRGNEIVQHWRVHEVRVLPNPTQTIRADGERLRLGKIRARVLPQALRVLVPEPSPSS